MNIKKIYIEDNLNNYIETYYYLLNSYDIKINKEYQFIYDEFFEHVIYDTDILVEKNFNPNKKGDKDKYKMVVFKGVLYRHLASKSGNKLRNPEAYPEIKRTVRLKKLQKLQNAI